MTSTVPRPGAAAAVTGLAALFPPRGIAVVGASRNPSKLGATLARSLDGFATLGGHLALVKTLLDRLGITYLLEAMAPPGVDLVLGARRDPVFGPILLFGLGGTTAEALADVAIRLAPLTTDDAVDMPGDLAGRELLEGWRGGPVLDHAELGRIAAKLGDLLVANSDLDDIEINPLRLTGDGLIALDAVVLTRAASTEAHRAHTDQ